MLHVGHVDGFCLQVRTRIARPAGPAMTGPASLTPTVRRHRLGAELRRLREARSLRLEDVASTLDVAPSTISRIETGKAPTRTSYLAVMLDLYQLQDPGQRRFLTDLAREGQRKSWWADHADTLPAHAGSYLDLEATASRAQFYCTQAPPGLLQSREYAAAICRAAWPGPAAEHVTAVLAIQVRRLELALSGGLRIHAVIEEAALRTPPGTDSIMAAQLQHLLTVISDISPVTIQVLALATARPAISPPFAALEFADPADMPVVCYGVIAGQVILTTRPSQVRAARAVFASLARTALSPAASADLIRQLAGQPASAQLSADCRRSQP